MPAHKKYNITRELLIERYEKQQESVSQIASAIGCTCDLIYRYLKKYGVNKRSKAADLTGQRFHSLVVRGLASKKGSAPVWSCDCDCGNRVELTSAAVRRKKTCGCKIGKKSIKHGMSSSRPYNIWRGMKTRCDNPRAINYPNYGGRGIFYDPAWKTFDGFWADMKRGYAEGLTLDRKNGNEGYSKGNCRWITPKEQNLNMRTNHLITCGQEAKTVTEWAEALGIKRTTLFCRLAKSDDEARLIAELMSK